MAIQNPRIFGLAVPRNLTDIKDSDEALLNLGLDIRDLEVIRGIAAQGFDSNNLQTLSGLDVPIWKTFDRYRTDVSTYNGQLSESAGSDFRVAGNIEVHGPISANAFRYTLFDNTIGTPSLRWGDISTSRVSSWSSFTASISYGSDVKIAGTLFAGALKTQEIPTARTFDSEVPTHRIKLRLNGTDQYFYVMKGIPIRFKGFFRDFDFTLDFQTQTVKNSWRIYRTNGLEVQDFENIGSFSSSTLNYRSPFSAERFIEAYINPEIVERIVLSNCNIQELPKSRLPNLETLVFANNGLTVFPDLNFFSPALQSLNIDNNPFYNGPTADEKKFSKQTMSRIPATLTNLDATGCFKGGIQQNIFNRLKSLSRIDINRTSDIFFFSDSLNPTGALPNFYGISGLPVTHAIGSIALVDHDFRTIEPGVQGGIDEVTLDSGQGGSGGNNYNNSNTGVFNDVPLTTTGSGSNATADITIDGGIVVGVVIKNVGSGYQVGDTLSANNTDLGGTGTGLAIIITEVINVLSIKQLVNITGLAIRDNNSLNDPNFSLNCPTTLTNLDILRTQLAVPNVSNFTELTSVDFYGGSGRGSFHTGWDGVFGGVGYPRTDAENFKFNNCPVLSNIRANYSDISGYLPKYALLPSLTNYQFFATNNIIAGRPGKRKILKLLQGGGITQLGAFNEPAGRPYTGNQTTRVPDTLDNAGATEGAIVDITTDSNGDVVQVNIVQAGSGYTTSDLITIPPGALGSNKGGTIDIVTVATGTIGSNDYDDGNYTETDDSSNTFAGINAEVTFTISGGAVSQYSLTTAGQDYQTGESITIPTSVVGGTDPLQFIIEEAEAPKILYNDQFTSNPNITSIDISINNSNFAGEVESGAFVPVRESLQFFRLQAAGRITGNFPNLEDQLELRDVRSSSQGWSGPLPSFSSSVFLDELYLAGNNFTGTFLYTSKTNLRIISLGDNNISLIDNTSSLPACTSFQMDNNDLSGNIPALSSIMPNVQSLGLANNSYTGYVDGTLNDLLKIRTLDLSGNQLGVTQVDNILFDMVDNWQQANRGGVTVNLTGGNMAAPTPYPITGGIINTFIATNGGFVDQPSITDGILTDIGSVVNVPAGYVPVAGLYESALNYDGDGSGARVTINVTNDFLEDVPIAINTTPSFTGTVGEITGSVTPVANGETGLVVGPTDVDSLGPYTDDGTLAANSADPAFVAATINLNYNGPISQSEPISATLITGGAGYSLQAGDQIRIPAGTVNINQTLPIVVTIGAVQEFTNGTAAYADTEANTAAGSGAAVSVTVGRGGLDITSTLVDPDATPGTGYLDTEQITIELPGSMPNSGQLTYDIDTVQDEYYTDTNYAVELLNSGGEGYSVNDILTTNDVISFRDPTTSGVVNGGLQLQVGTITSQTNRSVFTGFGAVEFLRGKGWTVRVES